ncbi:MAG: hypothetical protein OHK0023_26920 [Anaerolineae bacterium]
MAKFVKHGLYQRNPPLVVEIPDNVTQPQLAAHFRRMAASALELAERLNRRDPRLDATLSEKISAIIGAFAAVSCEVDHFAALLSLKAIPLADLADLSADAYATLLDHQQRALSVVLSRIAYAAEKLAETPLQEDGKGLSAYRVLIQLMRRAKRIATYLAAVVAFGTQQTPEQAAQSLRERMLALIESPAEEPHAIHAQPRPTPQADAPTQEDPPVPHTAQQGDPYFPFPPSSWGLEFMPGHG